MNFAEKNPEVWFYQEDNQATRSDRRWSHRLLSRPMPTGKDQSQYQSENERQKIKRRRKARLKIATMEPLKCVQMRNMKSTLINFYSRNCFYLF